MLANELAQAIAYLGATVVSIAIRRLRWPLFRIRRGRLVVEGVELASKPLDVGPDSEAEPISSTEHSPMP